MQLEQDSVTGLSYAKPHSHSLRIFQITFYFRLDFWPQKTTQKETGVLLEF